MKRNVIEIDKDKCIGCGLCAKACHQEAIKIIDKKATLVSDSYCDGLGMCLPACPVDAIKLIEKDTQTFDESRRGYAKKQNSVNTGGCPGLAVKTFKVQESESSDLSVKPISQLRQWPVQMKLINTQAEFLNNADLLVAADCCAYAYGNFHNEIMKDKVTVIGCPKLDDNQYYIDKLTEIFKSKEINSITVARMSVPCCGGIVNAVKSAMANSESNIEYKEIIISPDGKIINKN